MVKYDGPSGNGTIADIDNYPSYFLALQRGYMLVCVFVPMGATLIILKISMHQQGYEGFNLVDNPMRG